MPEISEHGRRRSGLTLRTRLRTYEPSWLAEISHRRRFISIFLALGPRWGELFSESGRRRRAHKRPLVLLHCIGKRRGWRAIVYAHVPPYRTHRTHSNIPTTYTPSLLRNSDGERTWCARTVCTLSFATLPHSSPYSSSLFLRSG